MNEILIKAKESKLRNDFLDEMRKERELKVKQERESDELLKMVAGYSNFDYRKENFSNELLEMIDEYGFEITGYEKNFEAEDNLYEELLEVYYCKYNNWFFSIEHISSCDFPNGGYFLKGIRNVDTGEKIHFSCILNRKDAVKSDVVKLIKLLNYNSEKEFINNEFNIYLELVDLFKAKGISCTIINQNLKVLNVELTMKLSSNIVNEELSDAIQELYLKVYEDENGGYALVATNNDEWDSGIRTITSLDNRAYYIDYSGKEDFSELMKVLDCLNKHNKGEIGFIEDGEYLNDKDIKKFFISLKNVKESFNKWNSRMIHFEFSNYSDYCGREYEQIWADRRLDNFAVNKYRGLEINQEVELSFNDICDIDNEYEINKSIIKVVYDKVIDKENCILSIKNYLYKAGEEVYTYDYDEINGTFSCVMNDKYMVGEVEYKGKFSYVMERLKTYVYELCHIYDVQV